MYNVFYGKTDLFTEPLPSNILHINIIGLKNKKT